MRFFLCVSFQSHRLLRKSENRLPPARFPGGSRPSKVLSAGRPTGYMAGHHVPPVGPLLFGTRYYFKSACAPALGWRLVQVWRSHPAAAPSGCGKKAGVRKTPVPEKTGTGVSACQKASQSMRPQAQINCKSVFSGDMCLGKNSSRPANVQLDAESGQCVRCIGPHPFTRDPGKS